MEAKFNSINVRKTVMSVKKSICLKEYSVIPTTSFYDMNQKIKTKTKTKKKIKSKISVDSNFTFSSYA